MTDYVLKGLMKRRAKMAGQVEAVHAQRRKMVDDLEGLDATIRQFQPGFQVETIRPKAFRPPKEWTNRGQMSRGGVLSILRQATKPLTSRDVRLEMLVTRVMNPSDQRLVRLMVKRVSVALQKQRENGALRST